MINVWHSSKLQNWAHRWPVRNLCRFERIDFTRSLLTRHRGEMSCWAVSVFNQDWLICLARRCCCWFVCRENKTLECVCCCGQYASNWEALTAIKIGEGDLRTLLLDYITHYHNRSCYFMFMVCAFRKLQLTRSQHGDQFFSSKPTNVQQTHRDDQVKAENRSWIITLAVAIIIY